MVNAITSTNSLSKVVAVLLALMMVILLLYPLAQDMESSQGEIKTETITNVGVPFALADADDEAHNIFMNLNGNFARVTVDGEQIPIDLESILPIRYGETNIGPFNTYYVAINLSDGDNVDDSVEPRLSKVKGEVAYYLNVNDLHKTANGYTFTPTLYNIMLVIPPVYWYSDSVNSKLYIANNPDAFVSMGISADLMKDYAHTYTDNGVVGHAPAIMIGVYEGYADNGVLVSQSNRQPTGAYSVIGFNELVNAGNTNVNMGTYELWNYYMWTLYRIMGWTVMGNMDSQYMMGLGFVGSASAPTVTGKTLTPFQKSPNNLSSVSLFVENGWGSINEWLGDTVVVSGVLNAGNNLGGVSSSSDVVNMLDESVQIPIVSGTNYYATINPVSDAFGTAVTLVSTISSPGEGINDRFFATSNPERAILVGGRWTHNNFAGISSVYSSDTWSAESPNNGARISYVITDSSFKFPMGANTPYAYIMDYNVNGTVQDVSSVDDGAVTSRMPIGTSLNEYWTYVQHQEYPSIEESTSNVTLAYGQDALLQLYNSGEAVIQTSAGTIYLGRINESIPTPILLTIRDGILTYDSGSVPIYTYRANTGDMVLTASPTVLNDTIVYYGLYNYHQPTSNGETAIGYIYGATPDNLSQSATVLAPEKTVESVSSDVHKVDTQYTVLLNRVVINTQYDDSDTSEVTVNEFIVPATLTYEVTKTLEDEIAYQFIKFLPLFCIICLIGVFIIPMAYHRY